MILVVGHFKINIINLKISVFYNGPIFFMQTQLRHGRISRIDFLFVFNYDLINKFDAFIKLKWCFDHKFIKTRIKVWNAARKGDITCFSLINSIFFNVRPYLARLQLFIWSWDDLIKMSGGKSPCALFCITYV